MIASGTEIFQSKFDTVINFTPSIKCLCTNVNIYVVQDYQKCTALNAHTYLHI